MEKFEELREVIESLELVDAHAHNIVALDSSVPFLSCFSEATGDALLHATHTLSFKRSLRDIAELYRTEVCLQDVQEYRSSLGLESISSFCFKAARISTILMDDGIELDKKHDIEWHKKFAPVVHRILRIEHLAEKILDEGISNGLVWTLDTFMETFVAKLKSLADKVVALKSIVANRSGLNINTNVTREEANEGFTDVLHGGNPFRITNKSFIDYIFTQSLEVALSFDLPMQIHTGFGDKDLDQRLSNPLHLRNLLEDKRFSKCRLVLLHASYPFSREASYLASVYPQVFLDFGLAIPKLSIHGMISSVKEIMELSPINKVMFSTDGCTFPESFYLGAKKARDVVFLVLRDACIDGDLSIPEAVSAAKDIFLENAKQFYKLSIAITSFDSKVIAPCNYTKIKTNAPQQDVSLVRLIWVDASGQHRCRVVPEKRFHDLVKKNGVGLTTACMAMSSAMDGPAAESNLNAVGEIRLIPDLSTQCRIPWTKQEEMVMVDMHLKVGEPWEYCPREALRRVSRILKNEFNLEIKAGFEIEFFLLKNVSSNGKEEWASFDRTPYCSSSGFDAASPVLHEVVETLLSLNIPVEQLHAEAGKGQFEMALGYLDCSNAADNLIFAREAIRATARKHGMLATFMPKYALDDIGSGSHVHLSLWSNGKNVFMATGSSRYGMSTVGEEFMAGVLDHLPSLLAFTAPIPNSYDRIQPNTWSGAYQIWGKENREAPLRTACPPGVPDAVVSNFEIKSFDGSANPYLGLASVIAAGIDGLRRHLNLPEPIDVSPESIDMSSKRLPKSLMESIEALEKDTIYNDLIGEKLLVAIKGVRKAEIQYYSENKDAHKQLIHLY